MATSNTNRFVTRRAALAGFGAGGLSLAAAAATTRMAGAQETAAHPIVGLWTQVKTPETPPGFASFATFHGDGTITSVHSFAGPGVGAWKTTGERMGDGTTKFLNIAGEPGGYVSGIVTARSSFTVDADGNSMTENAGIELKGSDGTVVAAFPFSAKWVRVAVEPPPAFGTPEAGTPTP